MSYEFAELTQKSYAGCSNLVAITFARTSAEYFNVGLHSRNNPHDHTRSIPADHTQKVMGEVRVRYGWAAVLSDQRDD